MTLKTGKSSAWRDRIRKKLQRQIDEGGMLHGYRADGKYVARSSAGDRVVRPGEDGAGKTVRAAN